MKENFSFLWISGSEKQLMVFTFLLYCHWMKLTDSMRIWNYGCPLDPCQVERRWWHIWYVTSRLINILITFQNWSIICK